MSYDMRALWGIRGQNKIVSTHGYGLTFILLINLNVSFVVLCFMTPHASAVRCLGKVSPQKPCLWVIGSYYRWVDFLSDLFFCWDFRDCLIPPVQGSEVKIDGQAESDLCHVSVTLLAGILFISAGWPPDGLILPGFAYQSRLASIIHQYTDSVLSTDHHCASRLLSETFQSTTINAWKLFLTLWDPNICSHCYLQLVPENLYYLMINDWKPSGFPCSAISLSLSIATFQFY